MATQSLQDTYLNTLCREQTKVVIFLVNGIKLEGYIETFDSFVILLKNSTNQMVYKHAISTILPSENVCLSGGISIKYTRKSDINKVQTKEISENEI